MADTMLTFLSDTLYLVATRRLPPVPPRAEARRRPAPVDGCAPARRGGGTRIVSLARGLIALALEPVAYRARLAASSSGVTRRPTKTV